jgi:ABC-type Zn2+ transport system substrate-binding protein/surface adhesin
MKPFNFSYNRTLDRLIMAGAAIRQGKMDVATAALEDLENDPEGTTDDDLEQLNALQQMAAQEDMSDDDDEDDDEDTTADFDGDDDEDDEDEDEDDTSTTSSLRRRASTSRARRVVANLNALRKRR